MNRGMKIFLWVVVVFTVAIISLTIWFHIKYKCVSSHKEWRMHMVGKMIYSQYDDVCDCWVDRDSL